MKLLIKIVAFLACFTATAQTSSISKWIESEINYTDSSRRTIKVYSSFPKGGGNYIDSAGTNYSYVIFWFRLVNESTRPAELAISFPASPFKIFPSSDSHIRLFLPPDAMTIDKVLLGDYGLTDLKSFLDSNFNKAGTLRRTMNPKDDFLFYVPVIFYQARGTTRAALVLNGQDLFLRISVHPDVESELIPCGQLTFRD